MRVKSSQFSAKRSVLKLNITLVKCLTNSIDPNHDSKCIHYPIKQRSFVILSLHSEIRVRNHKQWRGTAVFCVCGIFIIVGD